MNIIYNLLTPNPYSRPQIRLEKVSKIAVHYVGNAGSTAIANRNYFDNLKNTKATYASSHYIVGLDGEIIMCVPESEIAYCTNSANSYSISIENCHPFADGKFNDKTYSALLELCADICRRHSLDPLTDIIRHYDVTGKYCPLYYVNNPASWIKLKQDVSDFMRRPEPAPGIGTVLFDGVETDIIRIFQDGTNYIRLRDLEKFGFTVGYDPEKKLPVITHNGLEY